MNQAQQTQIAQINQQEQTELGEIARFGPGLRDRIQGRELDRQNAQAQAAIAASVESARVRGSEAARFAGEANKFVARLERKTAEGKISSDERIALSQTKVLEAQMSSMNKIQAQGLIESELARLDAREAQGLNVSKAYRKLLRQRLRSIIGISPEEFEAAQEAQQAINAAKAAPPTVIPTPLGPPSPSSRFTGGGIQPRQSPLAGPSAAIGIASEVLQRIIR